MVVDILLRLPPEIVQKILGYLTIDDVLRCVTVCRRWNLLICDLDSFWKRKCIKELGLSITKMNDLLPKFKHAKDLYMVAKRDNLPIAISLIGHRLLCMEYHSPLDVYGGSGGPVGLRGPWNALQAHS